MKVSFKEINWAYAIVGLIVVAVVVYASQLTVEEEVITEEMEDGSEVSTITRKLKMPSMKAA